MSGAPDAYYKLTAQELLKKVPGWLLHAESIPVESASCWLLALSKKRAHKLATTLD